MKTRYTWRIAGAVAGVAIGVVLAYLTVLVLLGAGVFGIKQPGPLGQRGENMVAACLFAVWTVAGAFVGYRMGRRNELGASP